MAVYSPNIEGEQQIEIQPGELYAASIEGVCLIFLGTPSGELSLFASVYEGSVPNGKKIALLTRERGGVEAFLPFIAALEN